MAVINHTAPNDPRGDLEHRYYGYLHNQGYATTDALLGVLRA